MKGGNYIKRFTVAWEEKDEGSNEQPKNINFKKREEENEH